MKVDSTVWVPLGSAVLVALGLFAGYRWLDDRLDDSDKLAALQVSEANKQFQLIGFRLERIEEQVSDRWTRPEMRALWTIFAADNPTIKVRPVEDH